VNSLRADISVMKLVDSRHMCFNDRSSLGSVNLQSDLVLADSIVFLMLLTQDQYPI